MMPILQALLCNLSLSGKKKRKKLHIRIAAQVVILVIIKFKPQVKSLYTTLYLLALSFTSYVLVYKMRSVIMDTYMVVPDMNNDTEHA